MIGFYIAGFWWKRTLPKRAHEIDLDTGRKSWLTVEDMRAVGLHAVMRDTVVDSAVACREGQGPVVEEAQQDALLQLEGRPFSHSPQTSPQLSPPPAIACFSVVSSASACLVASRQSLVPSCRPK